MARRKKKSNNNLLQYITKSRMSPEQKAFQQVTFSDAFRIYRFRREPLYLDEFDQLKYPNIAIWCENGTFICFVQNHWDTKLLDERNLPFTIDDESFDKLYCVIYGKTDVAIADTAEFVWSLKHSRECKSRLQISFYGNDPLFHFDFAALQPEQLARILDANSSRCLDIEAGSWNAEQSAVFATRPYPLDLEFSKWSDDGFSLEDLGTAFVDALQARQRFPFGSFSVAWDDYMMFFSQSNLRRLFELEISFEKLKVGFLDQECWLFPFSANANALEYEVEASTIRPDDFASLDIVTKDLSLEIWFDDVDDWDVTLISFFNRLADLGHLERLHVAVSFWGETEREPRVDDENLVAEALIKAIKASHNLKYLDVSEAHWYGSWYSYFPEIFKAMEDHKGLRTFVVKGLSPEYDDESDSSICDCPACNPAYGWLEQLLSRNRNITVCDQYGKTITNGGSIDKLYLLNAFYNGSAKLVKESRSARPLLVATTLVKRASRNFQYSALLLANHTDVLCEIVHEMHLE